VTLNQSPLNNGVSASWSYPYNLQNTPIELNGSPVASISSSNNVKPSAQFFVFTGVTSMILALILLLVYVFLDRQYRNDERLPIIDFVITVIWSIFWIAGSSAWAQGVSNIRSQTSPAAIAQRSGVCSDAAPCIEVDCKT
jgi:O-antigen/teichoic acid export membrane protein